MQRVQTDVRKVLRDDSVITSATALPFVNCEGLNNRAFYYIDNNTTGAIYYLFRGCYTNTSTTSYWTTGATATVATGALIGSTFAVINSYMTLEFMNTATGAGSAIMQLCVY
uniref:Uncharacterized protein n=1 Tax=viral metagenome TaxID=1070528 RepID=A0A6H1ZZ18_9ZZZZ